MSAVVQAVDALIVSIAGLWLLAACAELPAPGTPEAARACDSLRMTVEQIQKDYPDTYGVDFDADVAHAAFMLQAAQYKQELGCSWRVRLDEYELCDKGDCAK